MCIDIYFYLYRYSPFYAYLVIDLNLCGTALTFVSMLLFISMSISLSFPVRGCILSKGVS